MNSLNSDLLEIIIARLPLKSITTCKLVCKEWKSMVESPYLRELFLCHHQNSHSSWSLICGHSQKEVLAHYGCDNWGLSRSLGSYISSFLTDKFETTLKEDPTRSTMVRVVAYTDVGFILISLKSVVSLRKLYVANPISRQCVEIPPLPPPPPPSTLFRIFRPIPSGLATQVENGVVLGYKVVVVNSPDHLFDVVTLLIYSSETGLWSFKTLHSSLPFRLVWFDPVGLNGIGFTLNYKQVVVSHDFYTESDQCQVLHFPDLDNKSDFRRPCTASQGFLMYMNISVELKLRVWRLESEEWRLVSQVSLEAAFDYIPLAINPFDSNKVYLQRKRHDHCLASTNLHICKFGLHNNLDHSSDGGTLCFAGESHAEFPTFVLPRWLYRIPSPPS